jgi:hypothetical protein
VEAVVEILDLVKNSLSLVATAVNRTLFLSNPEETDRYYAVTVSKRAVHIKLFA